MKIAAARPSFSKTQFNLRAATIAATIAMMLVATHLTAATVVARLSGGSTAGYKDGTAALFHTPVGLALDEDDGLLFIADQSNNAVRVFDFSAPPSTFTFVPTNLFNHPVGVALDSDDNVYVLNRGNGTNGTLMEFDIYGDLLATNVSKLTNAAAIALDPAGNVYITARSNALIQISDTTNIVIGSTNIVGGITNIILTTTVVTTIPTNITVVTVVTNAGTSLQGIVVKQDGLIAACDSGNSGIWLIDPANPTNGNPTKIAGFNGAGDNTNVINQLKGTPVATAKFNQPHGVAEAGDGSLIITDYGNNKVKVLNTAGVVTNLYGVSSNYWGTSFPGFVDGTVAVPDAPGGVAARQPNGIIFASDGTVYVTEDFYQLIRKAATGLPLPPPPPPAAPAPAAPVIGFVTFPPDEFLSALTPVTSFVLNNDVLLAIEGTSGTETFYTSGATGTVPDPSTNSSEAQPYQDGEPEGSVADLGIGRSPDMTIKAITVNGDGTHSSETVARFQFITANPIVNGNNAAQFTITNITSGAQMYYTIDGSNPTNDGSGTSVGPIVIGQPLSFNLNTNLTIKIRAFHPNFQPSGIVSATFSTNNLSPNTISFGFVSGEASSDFVASPGQTFVAPVTLSVLPNETIYSLQFNLTVTNGGPNPGPSIAPGAFGFTSMLEEPLPGSSPPIYEEIPPLMFYDNTVNPPPNSQIVTFDGPKGLENFVNGVVTNISNNLLAVGWLERAGQRNLYDTTAQTLITFSQAHDVQFLSANGKVEVGGYEFTVPVGAGPGQTYQIQIGRPSATSDGIGAPGSSVFIFAPTNSSLGGGTINAIKDVTVGQRKYIVGDAYPFRWFNAGDFGNTNLENADVEQVFESAIYGLNTPPSGSDFFDAMDSCGYTYVDNGHGYLEEGTEVTNGAALNSLFDGNDTTINQIAFGNGLLDVCDVYVTYRRSLDPSLTWFQRFWTNGVRVAQTTANVFNPSVVKKSQTVSKAVSGSGSTSISITNRPRVNFTSADFQGSAGHIVHIPITAQVFGSYPLRVLMLNLTVVPLDGSPALTTPVQFTPNSSLGNPTFTDSDGNGNYAATWLNSGISGLTGNVSIGTLTVTIPTNAASLSSYAVHFDHASASPNGIASFPKQTLTGLITLASRSTSSFGDAIPDSWRLRYFGTTNNILSEATADADGDGVNNLQEYLAGTDPTDPNSYLSVGTDQSAATQSQDAVIHWPSMNGKKYIIWRSTSLFPPAWTPISTNNATGTEMEIHDLSGGNNRFYRVSAQ